jgi:toxin-antitoxin system PIN domain toxin
VFVVDANVFVYAANRDAPEQARCLELLSAWRTRTAPWCTTWPILYELIKVASHRNVFPRPLSLTEAWRFVASILASPSLQVLVETPRHAAVAAELFAEAPRLSGGVLHDAHTAVLMREHGIHRIYTRDADFKRFPGVDVMDPFQ